MKNVSCSYTWSRVCARHVLAGSAKVEFSSSPPARLKEPAWAPRLFQFNATVQLLDPRPKFLLSYLGRCPTDRGGNAAPPTSPSSSLALAFLLELAMLAAYAYWGFQAGTSIIMKVVLGIGDPL